METKRAQGEGSQAPAKTVQDRPRADPQPQLEHVSDPDEDDLDDLDDLLDEFSITQIAPTAPATLTSKSNESTNNPELPDAAGDEFNKQLQEQMAALLGNVDETPEMKKEIEAMMRELGAAADPGAGMETGLNDPSAPPIDSSSGEDAFQETIRKTMERMQNSGEQASAAATSDDSDDFMAQMLKEMQSGGLTGAGGEEDFSKMLMSMMEQLTNKDILYEPMKELHDKYPAWMSRNREATKAEDLRRYEEQQRLVEEIVRKFEERGYSDSKAADREYIVERMQKMQGAGSPPADLVGDMNGAQEALGNLDAGCPQQ